METLLALSGGPLAPPASPQSSCLCMAGWTGRVLLAASTGLVVGIDELSPPLIGLARREAV